MQKKTLFRMQFINNGSRSFDLYDRTQRPYEPIYVEQSYADNLLSSNRGQYKRTGDHIFFIEESQPILNTIRHEIFQLHQWRPTTGIYVMFNIKKIPCRNTMTEVIMPDGSKATGIQKMYDTQVSYDIKEYQ